MAREPSKAQLGTQTIHVAAFPIWKWNHVTIRIKGNVSLNEAKKILKVLSFQSQKWIECHVRAFPFSLFSSRFCSYFFLFSTESLNGMIDQWHEPKRGKWNLKLQRREAALKIITAGGPCQFIFIFSAVLYSQIFLKFPLKYHLVLF